MYIFGWCARTAADCGPGQHRGLFLKDECLKHRSTSVNMSSVYAVSNGKIGDRTIMTMGHSHNMPKRLPPHELVDGKHTRIPTNLGADYTGFSDDLDWFVWEPVESAHIVDTAFRRPIDDARLSAIAVPAGMPTALRVPFGRYAEAHKVVRIRPPCTTRDLLTLLSDFYTRPATAADVEAVRAAKGGDDGSKDDEYTRFALEELAAGRVVKLVDLCGSSNYSFHRLDEGPLIGAVISEVTGLARLEATLDWPARRHPLGDCMGMVRFEGFGQGQRILARCSYRIVGFGGWRAQQTL